MLDKTGRKIDYLRVSLTDRCNLRCIYCMPEEGIPKKTHDDIVRFENFEKVISAFATLGIKKVRFTGGEPLILNGIEKLIKFTSSLPSIEDVSLTTNGILLYDKVEELKKAGLNRVNISLDTLNKEKYKKITRGGDISKVLSAIEKCISIDLKPVKINVVLMKGINDDEVEDFINLTKAMPVQVRFIELMPIGEGLKFYEKSSMKIDEIIDNHKELIHIKDKSNVASVYKIEGAKGTVGFISPISCKFCNNCNRIRLTSTGSIKPCLHSHDEISLKPYFNDEKMLKKVIEDAIYNKPDEHHLAEDKKSQTDKMMYQIGG
ncbi:cyclic pyranopterin phosphate synthase [Sedimentibacter acidaminivorans]|jgi:GTP 3',8-cyclase|uniref:GTP 3',8-cyclase n=1 Tax=Sedimentibacter acidaminivorans TaxID=913099 RepID=A0ABS4GHI5_9FIRM|nr:GTP 3',8-cyclase MoaA [Sedimentibacter acidaminivorans]MBP1927140.1 cyclic pyranopterin phosphate synthase [Sedimentibacter acidaminivorans]